jgi:hypothetical protein
VCSITAAILEAAVFYLQFLLSLTNAAANQDNQTENAEEENHGSGATRIMLVVLDLLVPVLLCSAMGAAYLAGKMFVYALLSLQQTVTQFELLCCCWQLGMASPRPRCVAHRIRRPLLRSGNHPKEDTGASNLAMDSYRVACISFYAEPVLFLILSFPLFTCCKLGRNLRVPILQEHTKNFF